MNIGTRAKLWLTRFQTLGPKWESCKIGLDIWFRIHRRKWTTVNRSMIYDISAKCKQPSMANCVWDTKKVSSQRKEIIYLKPSLKFSAPCILKGNSTKSFLIDFDIAFNKDINFYSISCPSLSSYTTMLLWYHWIKDCDE